MYFLTFFAIWSFQVPQFVCLAFLLIFCSGATSVVKEVTQKGTKQNFAMKVIKKNVSFGLSAYIFTAHVPEQSRMFKFFTMNFD